MSLEILPPKRLVLIVEDNSQVRRIVRKSLKQEGYATKEAKNGQEALELLNEINPDLILSDINMPKLDGFAFYEQWRSSSQGTTIPFIFLTSADSPEEIQRGRNLGVEDYLTKPIDNEELVEIITARLYRMAEIEAAHMEKAYLDTVKSLATAIEGRDRYTRGHIDRITTYSLWVAKTLKWPKYHIRNLKFGTGLHDIGKVAIPAKILNKPDPLTKDEWNIMKKHPLLGVKMIQGIQYLRGARPYILCHHECWDGSGYPKGLAGEQIPIQGRLLSIVDTYETLTTTRPYRPARPHKEVIQYLSKRAGKEFDLELTRIFIEVINQYRDAQKRNHQS